MRIRVWDNMIVFGSVYWGFGKRAETGDWELIYLRYGMSHFVCCLCLFPASPLGVHEVRLVAGISFRAVSPISAIRCDFAMASGFSFFLLFLSTLILRVVFSLAFSSRDFIKDESSESGLGGCAFLIHVLVQGARRRACPFRFGRHW